MPVDRAFEELHTPRLVIRRFGPADASRFAGYRSDPNVARYQSWDSYTVEQAERFVREIGPLNPGTPGDWFQFAAADPSSDELLGDVALRVHDDDVTRAEIGFTFAPEHQGRGYAAEAVRGVIDFALGRLGVVTVYAVTDARNHRSIALLERVAMRRVSTGRVLFKGEWCEEHTYELRREGG